MKVAGYCFQRARRARMHTPKHRSDIGSAGSLARTGHAGITQVAYNHVGKKYYSAGHDGTVRMWSGSSTLNQRTVNNGPGAFRAHAARGVWEGRPALSFSTACAQLVFLYINR